MAAAKNGAKSASGSESKKPWTQPVKQQVKTVMPEGVKIQVHQRQTPPASYRICNGTTVELYQPKTWGR